MDTINVCYFRLEKIGYERAQAESPAGLLHQQLTEIQAASSTYHPRAGVSLVPRSCILEVLAYQQATSLTASASASPRGNIKHLRKSVQLPSRKRLFGRRVHFSETTQKA